MVMIQSPTVKEINISRCVSLKKALIQCSNLTDLGTIDLPSLSTLVIWSDTLSELDISSSTDLFKCELYCPKLKDPKIPPLRRKRVEDDLQLPDIANILKKEYQLQARKEAEESEQQRGIIEVGQIPRVYRV